MKKICFLFALLPMLGCGQNSKTKNSPSSQDSVINKWLHAIINIETRSRHKKTMIYLQDQLKNKIITPETIARLWDSTMVHSPNSSGTALFIRYGNKDFLLTARHVLIDPEETDSNGIYIRFILLENDSLLNSHNDITIDPQSNRFSSKDAEEITINNLSYKEYVLSSPIEDLGIISLSGTASGFAKTLYKRGYKPILMQDVDTIFKTGPGDDIMLIGYPNESIAMKKIGLPTQMTSWESRDITIPVLSYGQVTDTNSPTHFQGNVFNYYGFSGGPVVSNGKLVGITSGFELKHIKTKNAAPFSYYSSYSAVFTKSALITALLQKLYHP